MRRVIIVLVLLAAIGAAVWFFMFRGAGGAPPSLAAQLDKANTVGFAVVEQPDALFSALLSRVDKAALPEGAPPIHDAELRSKELGFDPATAAGWQSIGIDAKAGVGIVSDVRLGGRPFVMAKIDDEAKFLGWLGKHAGGEAKIADGALTAGTKTPLAVARRGAFTLIGEHIKPEELKAIAEAKGEALSSADGFKAAFAGAKAGGRVTGFVPVANLKQLPTWKGPAMAPNVDFYANLFPAIGIYGSVDDFRIRLVTSEKGTSVLKQVLAPAGSTPKFSKWLPKEGYAVFRYSVNLKELFAGLQALLPPAVPDEVRMQLGMAPMALSFIGIDWNVVTEAFSGHVAFAIRPDTSGGGPPNIIALFGLGNGDKADTLINDLQKNASRLLKGFGGGGPSISDVEIEGAKGKAVDAGGMKLLLVRKGDMLIFATSEALAKETLARGAGQPSLAGTSGGTLIDSDAVFAGTMNVASMVPPGTPDDMARLLKGLPALETAVRLDRHGLAFEGQTVTLFMGVGLSAYLMMQRFSAFQKRAIEASEKHERLIKEQERVMREAGIEPPSAPVTAAPASAAP